MDFVLKQIQPSEWIKGFLEFKIRADGRHPAAIRDVRVMRGVLKDCPTIVGSSVVSAAHSRFLVGVSAEIAAPYPSAPESGKVFVNVEIPRCCGIEYEEASSIASQTSVHISRIFSNPRVLDLNQFCIKSGVAVWVLHVNVVCLGYDGNGLDWSLCALSAALEDSILPSIEWDDKQKWWRLCDDDGEDASDGMAATVDSNRELWKGRRVKLHGRPLSITLAKVLDNYWLIDPTLDESHLGHLITIWKTPTITTDGNPVDEQQKYDLHILRGGGSALDVHGLLLTLSEISHHGIKAMEDAIDKAVNAELNDETLWEVCRCSSGSDFEERTDEEETKT